MTERFGKNYFFGKKGSNYSNYEKLNHSERFKSLISFIEHHEIKGRFLDVGCALGFLIKEASPYFDELYGFDISRFAIERARQENPMADIRIIDLNKPLPYPDESFDCITALDVLEHTRHIEKNFEKIVKKLKKGGYLIVSMPIDSWPRKLFGFLDKDKTHISILRENKLLQIVEKNRLSILRKTRYCPAPVFLRIPYIPAEVELFLRKE